MSSRTPPPREVIIAKIEHAFATVPYPGDGNLAAKSYGDEPAELEEEFRGKRDWRALDGKFLDQAPRGWASALSFFSDEAFKFYLPAYLICDLRGELRALAPEFSLTVGLTQMGGSPKIAQAFGGGTMGDRARARFLNYDKPQVAAIVDYLWWKLSEAEGYEPTLEEALESYWLPRLDLE